MARSPEELFLLELCGLTPESSSPPCDLNWNSLWELTKKNAVEIQVCKSLIRRKLGSHIPPELLDSFESTLCWGKKRVDTFSQVLDQANAQGIPIALLKGAAFGSFVYRDLNYKRMNDIDLLIHRDDRDRFTSILPDLGFQTFDIPEKEVGSHHTPPWFCPASKTVLGIHWGLCSAKKHPIPETWLWERTREGTFNQRPVLTLNPEMHLLHLCIHLPFLKTGVRELADVCHLVRRECIDWDLFFQKAREAKAEAAVFRVLTLAQGLVPLEPIPPLPSDFTSKVSTFVKDETLARSQNLCQSRSTIITQVERWFILYKLSPLKSERRLAFKKIWRLIFRSQPPLFARGYNRYPMLKILSMEHGRAKVYGSLLAFMLHYLTQLFRSSTNASHGLLTNKSFELFWELE